MLSNYKVLEIESRPGLWYFFCVKLYDEYRYYGLVYDSETENCMVSLVDSDYHTIGNFKILKTKYKSPDELFLSICVDYDKFWYPELFEVLT